MTTPKYLGVDLGGTNIKAGLCDARGRILRSVSIPTEAGLGRDHAIGRIVEAARRVMDGAALGGIGVPGPLDIGRTVIYRAINLPGWIKVPLPRLLTKALGIPIIMENDANCAGVGEAVAGAGRGASSVALFTLGTGIGGAVVFDGRIWVGANGAAGEFGHMVLDPKGPRCGCGQRGCLEAFASATGVVRRYRELTGRARTAREILSDRSPAGRRVFDETVQALSLGVAAVLHVLHPACVILSGGMAAAPGLLPALKRAVAKRVFPMYLKGLRIAKGTLGDDAGWLGAAMVARERLR
jgi:glucokinase